LLVSWLGGAVGSFTYTLVKSFKQENLSLSGVIETMNVIMKKIHFLSSKIEAV
jgi:hypothetical protein